MPKSILFEIPLLALYGFALESATNFLIDFVDIYCTPAKATTGSDFFWMFNTKKPNGFMLFYMPIIIGFSRHIGTHISAKFELINKNVIVKFKEKEADIGAASLSLCY